MLRLSIKGSKKNATRAAMRHRVPVRNCVTKGSTTYCDAPCGKQLAVMRWMNERDLLVRGRGYPPGALLHFSTKSCG